MVNKNKTRKERPTKEKHGQIPTRKLKKDPGVPDLRDYTKKLANQTKVETAKRKAEEEKQRQKTDRQRLIDKNRKPARQLDIASLAKNAARRSDAFEHDDVEADDHYQTVEDAAASGSRDNSRKAYYREFKKVVEAADVILEVLDARDPLGCRALEVERMILDNGARKRIILVLNKVDLAPRENVEAWLKYLRNEYPTVAFKASTQAQRRNLGQAGSVQVASDGLLSGSECLGADDLVHLLKNYCRNSNMKTSITVGVIGFPNVGKSSVINSLRRAKVCGVGSTPGLTKVAQEICLDKNIKLLDCPGIVFDRGGKGANPAEVLLRNCVKVELLDDPITPVDLILTRCTSAHLQSLYNIPPFTTTLEMLMHIATQRGHLKRGGGANLESAARVVLNDWNSGKIKYFTVPPVRDTASQQAMLVQDWGKEFNVTEVISGENDMDMADRIEEKIRSPRVETQSLDMIEEEDEEEEEEVVEKRKAIWNGARSLLVKPTVQFMVEEAKTRNAPTAVMSVEESADSFTDMQLRMPGDEEFAGEGSNEEAFDFGEFIGGLPGSGTGERVEEDEQL